MSEKMEKRIKIGVALFLVFIALFTIITLTQHSKYDDAAHQIEQGKLPVYVTPPDEEGALDNRPGVGITNTDTNAENAQSTPTKPDINKNDYKRTHYEKLLQHAEKSDKFKVVVSGTIYSSVETANGNIYSIADKDGNYYSIIDKTGYYEKFGAAKVITCYGQATGIAKLNTQEIPQITIDEIEHD